MQRVLTGTLTGSLVPSHYDHSSQYWRDKSRSAEFLTQEYLFIAPGDDFMQLPASRQLYCTDSSLSVDALYSFVTCCPARTRSPSVWTKPVRCTLLLDRTRG